MQQTDVPPHTMTKTPVMDSSVFVAPSAQVVGDVHLKEHSSVWYNSVLRADINSITVGKRSNIQDGSVVHVTNDHACLIGDDVIVGHNVNLHGCTLRDACLIGIGAIILTGATVGQGTVVAAGAVVLEGSHLDSYALYAGIPAKKVKELPVDTIAEHLRWATKYVQLAEIHKTRWEAEGSC